MHSSKHPYIPGSIIWRPVAGILNVKVMALHDPPFEDYKPDRPSTRLVERSNYAWEPEIALTTRKGLVVMADNRPPPNWCFAMVIKPGYNALFVEWGGGDLAKYLAWRQEYYALMLKQPSVDTADAVSLLKQLPPPPFALPFNGVRIVTGSMAKSEPYAWPLR